MRKIIATTFMTLDGVMQAPGGLEEDRAGGFAYGIFAAYWPHTEQDTIVAKKFNSARKYVVSHTPMDLPWQNSTLITNDVATQIKKLKERDGPDLWVHGSGKRLFAEGTQAEGFKLTDSKISTTGVIIATYESAGTLKTGSFS